MNSYGIPDHKNLPTVIDRRRASAGGGELLSLVLDEGYILREELLNTGAILFRGFPTLSVPEFAEVAAAFAGKPLLDYTAGASPRTRLGGGVYTSTEYPN